MLTIRPALLADVPAITEIYNEAVLTTTATFDTETKTVEERRAWLEAHGPRHPVIVAELDGKVVGWASLSRWSEKQAYDDTAESSFYVQEEYRGRGIGRKLKEAIVAEAERVGLHTIIALITEGNAASIHLNEESGFRHIGVMQESGFKFGRRLDVYLMQKIFPERDDP